MARKISRSRPGKGVPSASAKGTDIMPAMVMAPRTPANEATSTSQPLTLRRSTPMSMRRKPLRCWVTHTHRKRIAIRTRLIDAT